MNIEPLSKKYQSFGWKTQSINGHSFEQIKQGFIHAQESKKPTVIISNTIPARGVYQWEGKKDTHHKKLTKEIYEKSIA